ncbi:hypothetical protein [Flammeovirga kamogawensis]|uniref:Lipoprotein n=1 Tax=Flammeovirga kamogawensis TaxID=373891 RepID=A0ABX8GTV1_9BACT|nr:hypothetical protein [Flammeovirga kamogawensis]MBB6463356.1 hypothetical protein [Flammeovirga kamogawensis]QWG06672.1 hypothetical protein KM029_15350 [Flammeovirga kamogawensis]TRX68494.1 hypothetical protein EO216_10345 [Flammeovirga kamogawensis]
MKKISKQFPLFVLVIGLFFSCGLKTSEKIDSNSVNKQIKERKIKRIKEPNIVEKGFSIGTSISNNFDQKRPCGKINLDTMPDSVSQFLNKAWVACDTPSNKIEKSLWDAYHYNIKNEYALNSNIQKIHLTKTEDAYLYSYPYLNEGKLRILQIELNHKALVLALY